MLRRIFPLFAGTLILATMLASCGRDPAPRTDYPSRQAQPLVAEPVRTATIPLTPPPAIADESAIVIDAHSGRVLYAKNADQPRPVASTQKLVTALVVMDTGNIDKLVKISAD